MLLDEDLNLAKQKALPAPTTPMQLIQDKTTQPLDPPTLTRRRLHVKLGESLACCTSTVIQGRAGSGKTRLAIDFARHCRRHIAWYTIDASDNDLRVFVRYLTASIGAQLPAFGALALDAQLASTEMICARRIAELFVHELCEAVAPLLIVLDDLHLLYDEEWIVEFFDRLLPLLPPEAHLLLIGRSLPPAPLWRLRSKQRLCIIDESALDFTRAEADELFRAYGLTTTAAGIAYTETSGRAALLNARGCRLRQAADSSFAPAAHEALAHDAVTRYGLSRTSSDAIGI